MNVKHLTPEQHRILRDKGTEFAFTGKYLNHKESGMYKCVGCDSQLFSSETKFDSGTGWPSFDQALPDALEFHEDFSHGMHRTEVICKTCKGHLGHLFTDGQTKTKKRYCINSASLCFDEK